MADDTPQPGDILLGKLRVERVLGVGGMGVVLEATHLLLDQRVAVKVMRQQALANPESVARFVREARAAARITGEHVARVLDVASLDDGAPVLVMEFLRGSDFASLLQAQGPLSLAEATEYALQACEALAEAHAGGIVHRDLKPANLFLTRRADGTPLVKVLDFGISKLVHAGPNEPRTNTNSLMGTPVYMSPEQLRSAREVDARTDVWSMGVVLYELLTARIPFDAETMPQVCVRIMTEPAPSIRVFRGELPEAVDCVILRCLEKKPEARFQSVAELAAALAPFAPARAKASVARIESILGARAMTEEVTTVGAPPARPEAGGGSAITRATFEGPPAPSRTRLAWVAITGLAVALAAITFLLLTIRARDEATHGVIAAGPSEAPSTLPPPPASAAPTSEPAPEPFAAAPAPAESLAPPSPATPPPSHASHSASKGSGRASKGHPGQSSAAPDTRGFGEGVN